jgi:hypothetical protein
MYEVVDCFSSTLFPISDLIEIILFVFHSRSKVQDPLALKLDRALMLSSFVFPLVPTGLFIKYFVRVDKRGLFHTYPDRGGPFHTLQEAQEAIDSHHVIQRNIM